MPETPIENEGYKRYAELGGIINEKDYGNVVLRVANTITLEHHLIGQAELIAKFAGIELCNTKDALDQRVVLYGILRNDSKPEGVAHHHSQMGDQRLFAEACRILGDVESLQKMIAAFPNISFG